MIQPGGPPPFERIAIVGLGLMGGSLALAIRQRWSGGLIIAVDRKHVLEAAMRVHVADVAADDLGIISGADLVVLAAPVRENIALLTDLADFVGDAIVTDVGSTKAEIVRHAQALPDRATFIGGHPLAGAALGGLASARPDLFDGRPWLLTTPVPEPALQKLEALIRWLGASPVRMEAAEHDRLLACLSHLPQIAVSALMHVVGERAGVEGLGLSGRGLRDTTRLASSPPGIWRDIAATNALEIGEAIDALIEVLQKIRGDLKDGDVLQRIFESAREWRAAVDNGPEGPR